MEKLPKNRPLGNVTQVREGWFTVIQLSKILGINTSNISAAIKNDIFKYKGNSFPVIVDKTTGIIFIEYSNVDGIPLVEIPRTSTVSATEFSKFIVNILQENLVFRQQHARTEVAVKNDDINFEILVKKENEVIVKNNNENLEKFVKKEKKVVVKNDESVEKIKNENFVLREKLVEKENEVVALRQEISSKIPVIQNEVVVKNDESVEKIKNENLVLREKLAEKEKEILVWQSKYSKLSIKLREIKK